MAVKIAAVIFSLCFSVLAPGASYSQEDAQQLLTQEIEGSVYQIDVVGGKMSLNVYDGVKMFLVSEKTKITRGIETISIDDIEIGDPLNVVYYVDKDGNFQAVRITDSNMGNE